MEQQLQLQVQVCSVRRSAEARSEPDQRIECLPHVADGHDMGQHAEALSPHARNSGWLGSPMKSTKYFTKVWSREVRIR